MTYRRILFCVSILVVGALRADAREAAAHTETAFGLHQTSFDTLHGTVTVNLPADTQAGDTISGTVVAEPEGTDDEERAANSAELAGFVVEVEEQPTPAKERSGTWAVPAAATAVALVLKDAKGAVIGRAQVPLPKPGAGPPSSPTWGPFTHQPEHPGYELPAILQAGRPFTVRGAFDGQRSGTAVRIDDRDLEVLAESPRGVVAAAPWDFSGPGRLEIDEGGKSVAVCSARSVGVRLSAPRTELGDGEQTTVTARLEGLEGLTGPLTLRLTNHTPAIVRMAGGDAQEVQLDSQVAAAGVERTVTGVGPAKFSISAAVLPPPGAEERCSPLGPASSRASGVDPRDGHGAGQPLQTAGDPPPREPERACARITLNGFTAHHETRDDFLALDGSGDEVANVTYAFLVDRAGGIGWRSIGGRGAPVAGVHTGNHRPNARPWIRELPTQPGFGLPMLVYAGWLAESTALVVIPSLWELDPPTRQLDQYEGAVADAATALAREVGEWLAEPVSGPERLTLAEALTRGETWGLPVLARVGEGPAARPIGMRRTGDQWTYVPRVFVLRLESLELFGRATLSDGIVHVDYVDDAALEGRYTVYLSVQRLRDEECAPI